MAEAVDQAPVQRNEFIKTLLQERFGREVQVLGKLDAF